MHDLPLRVIVGLGNPGRRYAGTRHNAGFLVVEALAAQAGASDWFEECQARTCRADLGAGALLLAEPLTFMNRSGDSLRLLRSRYGIAPADLMVVLDDFSLPFGRIRIRERGSAGGHNGLESILQAMESEEILRLRLGIGEEQMPSEKAEFVLSDFPPERQAELNDMIARACDAVKTVMRNGVSKAMAVFNA